MKRTVYLAGPIAGLTVKEAKDWWTYVKSRLAKHNIMGVSPLRYEPKTDERGVYSGALDLTDDDGGWAIGAKNEFDTRNCDMILAYLPFILHRAMPSVGTIVEIAWGKALNKPVMIVAEDPYLQNHPVLQHCVSWSLTNLDDAVDAIIDILGDYAS